MKDSTGVGKNPSTMAAEEQPDFAALAVERVRLERREPELAEQLQRALHRAGAFPSEFGLREVAKLKREQQLLVDRLAELSGLMLLVPLQHEFRDYR